MAGDGDRVGQAPFSQPPRVPCWQKRDIQLLKAYMRAIRSVNPNLQNLEETIEYNEILE